MKAILIAVLYACTALVTGCASGGKKGSVAAIDAGAPDAGLRGDPRCFMLQSDRRFGRLSPRLAFSGSELGLAWEEDTTALTPDGHVRYDTYIMFRRLNPDGTPKGPITEISSAPWREDYYCFPDDFVAPVWNPNGWAVTWLDGSMPVSNDLCSGVGRREVHFATVPVRGNPQDRWLTQTNEDNSCFGTCPELTWTGSEYGLAYEVRGDPMQPGLMLSRYGATGEMIGTSNILLGGGWMSWSISYLSWTGSVFSVIYQDVSSSRTRFLRVAADGVPMEEPIDLPEVAASGYLSAVAYNDEGIALITQDLENHDEPFHLFFLSGDGTYLREPVDLPFEVDNQGHWNGNLIAAGDQFVVWDTGPNRDGLQVIWFTSDGVQSNDRSYWLDNHLTGGISQIQFLTWTGSDFAVVYSGAVERENQPRSYDPIYCVGKINLDE